MYDTTEANPNHAQTEAERQRKAFEDMVEWLKESLEEMTEAFKELGIIAADYYRDKEWEVELQAQFRARSSGQAAARARAYALQMTHEKARQVMRRRKRLHT